MGSMGLGVDPTMEPLMQNAAEFYTSSSDVYNQKIDSLLSVKVTDSDPADPSKDWQRMFDVAKTGTK